MTSLMMPQRFAKEEARNPQGMRIFYPILFGCGVLILGLGLLFGDRQPVICGMFLVAYFGWRWAKFVRRDLARNETSSI
jgi:hypothetical protein